MEIKSLNKQKQIIQSDSTNRKKVDKEEAKEVNQSKIEDTFESTPDLLELKPVLDKLKSGFYDKPEVLSSLAGILDQKFSAEMQNVKE